MPDENSSLYNEQQFRAYLEQLESKVTDAEAHLGVPHGTLAYLHSDNDYVAVLKVHATIEPLLNELLEKNVTRVLIHPKVNFPGGDALTDFILKRNLDEKRTLAVKFELIDEPNSRFVKGVSDIRNRYAHNIKNVSLSIAEIAENASPNDGGASIIKQICGFSTSNTTDVRRIRALLYYRFARWLSVVLEGINPPPPKPILTGWLGDQ
ncbi:hypothetical protein IVB11_27620 [Bradyrhizobium sp. 177]|uniref:hypothetical protein n=1 Tax=Bradyrhizobium sp. 177 TaxID=2782647 RepID=UPI001FFC254E|nr:hypothetical protein [Bradyrhizobium sp. 177]MCK1552709.1 hypothetical protein [Bradyrhizobium sp. 177]